MPDNSTVRMQKPDGTLWDIPAANAAKATAAGWKTVSTPSTASPATAPGPVKRLLTQTAGVPEDLDTSVAGMRRDAPKLADASTWLDALKSAVKGLNPVNTDAATTAESRLVQPGVGNKAAGGLEFLEAGIPWAGGPLVRASEQMQKGDVAGGVGSSVNAAIQLLMMRGMPEDMAKSIASKSPAVQSVLERGVPASTATGPLRTAGQFLTGAGADAVEQAKKGFASDVAEDATKHASAVEKAKGKFTDDLATKRTADVARSRADSASSAKAAATDPASLRGPVYQNLESRAEAVGDDVKALDSRVRSHYNGKWEQLRQLGKDADVKWPVDAITKAREQLQTPGSQAQFDRIMSQVDDEAAEEAHGGAAALTKTESQLASLSQNLLRQGKTPVDIEGMLRDQGLSPARVRAVIATVPGLSNAVHASGGEPSLPFAEARARYTKLGEKMYSSGELPGDVQRALKTVRDILDSGIESSLPTGTARRFYSGLKSDWAQYMSDFYDPNGPFTRIKNAPTTVDRINLLTGKWGKEMLDSMSRYYRFGPNVGLTTRLRTLNRAIDALPSSTPKPAETPTLERPPAPPDRGIFDPVAARRQILSGKVPTGVTPGLFWKYALLRNIMRKLTNAPPVQDFLSQNPR